MGEPGKAADIVVRVIVVLAMVQPIPNTRKENLNIIIIITIVDKPARICQSQSKKLQISRRQCCLTMVIIMSKTTSTTVDQKTYIPFWWTGSPVSRADLLLENVSPWQAWSTCIFTTTGEGAGEVALSSNVTFLLGEQLETLVYASVKTAERAARESRWGVRIWAEMIKSLLSDLHIEEVDVGTVPNILLYGVIQKEC